MKNYKKLQICFLIFIFLIKGEIEESKYFIDLYEQAELLFCFEENFPFDQPKVQFNPQSFFHTYKKGLYNQAMMVRE